MENTTRELVRGWGSRHRGGLHILSTLRNGDTMVVLWIKFGAILPQSANAIQGLGLGQITYMNTEDARDWFDK